MQGRWRLAVRDGAAVRKSIHPTLEDALEALQSETVEAANRPHAAAIDIRVREFEPGDIVVMRAQVAGPQRFVPRIRFGVDVRGDGTQFAWRGGGSKRPVEVRKRETPWQALRRELGADQT